MFGPQVGQHLGPLGRVQVRVGGEDLQIGLMLISGVRNSCEAAAENDRAVSSASPVLAACSS